MMMGNEPSRWAPDTRETADHSLPYCVSVGLLDGAVANDSFTEARLRDPAIANLMRKVKVREDDKLNAAYPEAPAGRVTIRTTSGEVHTLEIMYPAGNAKNPMSDDEIERKFHGLLSDRLTAERREAALKALWDLENARDISTVIGLLG
jgi:2-methylcitrate dehydratase